MLQSSAFDRVVCPEDNIFHIITLFYSCEKQLNFYFALCKANDLYFDEADDCVTLAILLGLYHGLYRHGHHYSSFNADYHCRISGLTPAP